MAQACTEVTESRVHLDEQPEDFQPHDNGEIEAGHTSHDDDDQDAAGGDDASEDGDDDDDDDFEELTNEELRDNIKVALDDIRSTGDFSAFYSLPHFVDPHLCVGGDNLPVRLPLQQEDAAKIIAASSLAPFGMGSETVVDRTVRNTWEIDTSRIHMRNGPYFNDMVVRSALSSICTALGVRGSVRAEFYKLLLYEKGAFFKPHTE